MFHQREKNLYLEFEMEKSNISRVAKVRENKLSKEVDLLKKRHGELEEELKKLVCKTILENLHQGILTTMHSIGRATDCL